MRQLRRLKNLTGHKLQARDGEIGKLKQIYFDDRRWIVRYFVVQTGNWLIGQEVLIVPATIESVADETRQLIVNLTCEQISQSPPVDTELPVSLHYEQEYYRYYGWEPYWNVDPLFDPIPPAPPPNEVEIQKQPEHPHLRSSEEIVGYRLHAQDGEIGHIEDFVLDDQDWTIRYLEIDTGSWLPGKKVLLSPAWIREVDLISNEILVNLSQELIKTAPKYDPTKLISRDYQLALYKHYGKVFEDE